MGETTGNQTDEQTKTPEPGLFKRIFHHPTFGAWAGIIGIITGAFGVYAYYASMKEPELTFSFSPTRTPIVQKANLTDFTATYKGTPVTGDLSTAEIQIWNQGKLPIHRENILKPISIRTQNGEPIYQATVITNRDVIGFNWLNVSNRQNGTLQFDWKILERSDGFKIQIIYGGSVRLPLIIEGAIEGQRGISEYKDPNTQITLKSFIILIMWFTATIAYSTLTINGLIKSSRIKEQQKVYLDRAFNLIISCTMIIGLFIALYNHFSAPNPPFAF